VGDRVMYESWMSFDSMKDFFITVADISHKNVGVYYGYGLAITTEGRKLVHGMRVDTRNYKFVKI
jgi:hypothetical protein